MKKNQNIYLMKRFEIYIKSLDYIEKLDYYVKYNNNTEFVELRNEQDLRIYSMEDHTFCPITQERLKKYFGTGVKVLAEEGTNRIYTIFSDWSRSDWSFCIWRDCADIWVDYPDFISSDEMEL